MIKLLNPHNQGTDHKELMANMAVFHCKAAGHFARECPDLSAHSRADMNLDWKHSMKGRDTPGNLLARSRQNATRSRHKPPVLDTLFPISV